MCVHKTHTNWIIVLKDVGPDVSLIAPPPVRLFTGGFTLDVSVTQTMANYDIAGDGKRLLMLKPTAGANQTTPPINVVINWVEEVKARVPTK
jgi:hypothetical protein